MALDMKKEREGLIGQLREAQVQSATWTKAVSRLEGAISFCDAIIAAETPDKPAEPPPAGDTTETKE